MENNSENSRIPCGEGKEKSSLNPRAMSQREGKGKTKRGKGNRQDYRGRQEPRANDPSWYTPTEAIAKAVASIPFSSYPGSDFPFGGGTIDNANNLTEVRTHNTLPGVMRINYGHTVGGDNSAVSAVNMAARAIYTFVRHQNSGHANYESSDLMIYLLSVYECFALYCEGVRAYKTALTYSQQNRLIPEALLTAMGFRPSYLQQGLADFRASLNIIAAKLSSLCVPGDLPLIQRWAFLASNVWMDSSSETGQYYVPVLKFIGKYSPTEASGGSILFDEGGNYTNPSAFINKINSLLDVILMDEDSNIMSGDILKAYGREKMLKAVEVDDTAVLVPVYNEDFLNALENATFHQMDVDNFNITQKDGVIRQALHVDGDDMTNFILSGNIIFNSHKDAPDYRDVLEWSRFTAVVDPATDKTTGKREIRCGSEFVTGLDVIMRNGNSYSVAQSYNSSVLVALTQAGVDSYTTMRDTWNAAAMLAMFDWCPMVYSIGVTTSESGVEVTYNNVLADLDKPTLITPHVMERIHDTALLGEFKNPLLP